MDRRAARLSIVFALCASALAAAGSCGGMFTSKPGPALGAEIFGPAYAWMDAAGVMYFTDQNSGVYRISR